MGSNTSKPSNDSALSTQRNEAETVSNSSDPRSPTPEIIRTPMQSKTDAKRNITKNADLRKTFEAAEKEEKLIHNNPILSAVIKNHLQSYDPRSPTQDFERTPIVIPSKVDNIPYNGKLVRENCGSPILRHNLEESYENCSETQVSPELIMPKVLCNEFMDMTLNESIKEPEEPLGSSTASNEAIENNLSGPAPVLETNFDYEENILQHNTPNEETKTDMLSKIPRFKVLKDDPRSPSTGIDRTPIVVAKSEDESIDNVEEMSDDTLIKVLQGTNAELRQTGLKPKNHSEGLMIYEDTTVPVVDTPKKSKSDANAGSRTPLSCMKNKTDTGHARSNSANAAKESKGLGHVKTSHIPRLKSLTKPPTFKSSGSTLSLKNLSKVNTLGDCENTPPHSHRDKWDKDNSIVL